MCELISTVLGTMSLAISGIGAGAATAGMTAAAATGALATGVTVGGTLAAIGAAAAIGAGAYSAYSSYKTARASSKASESYIKALTEAAENNTGTLEVSKTASRLSDKNTSKRTLSSLMISLLPQAASNETITQNVYGVDTNAVASSTQNMTGLNIAA